jgi:transposase
MAADACIGHDRSMPLPADLDQLDADTLRRLLIEQERELVWRQTKIERLTHELAHRQPI